MEWFSSRVKSLRMSIISSLTRGSSPLVGSYSVVFVLHDRVTEVAEKVKIDKSAIDYELIDMEIQLLKGSLRSGKSKQFRMKLFLHEKSVTPLSVSDTVYIINCFAVLENYRAGVISPYITALRTEINSYDIG